PPILIRLPSVRSPAGARLKLGCGASITSKGLVDREHIGDQFPGFFIGQRDATNLDCSSPDSHQKFGATGACRRWQSMPRSTSKRAMLSTATEEVLSTEGLKPLPRSHDSGTT